MRFEVFVAVLLMMMMMMMMLFWVLVPFRLTGRYQLFADTYCLHLQG
jgi:hypothetical protein